MLASKNKKGILGHHFRVIIIGKIEHPDHTNYEIEQHTEIWRHSSSPICLALSVSGTYLTPMSLVLVIAPPPLMGLSTCSRYWSRPSGPTGIMIRPPGASWSTNFREGNFTWIVVAFLTKTSLPLVEEWGLLLQHELHCKGLQQRNPHAHHQLKTQTSYVEKYVKLENIPTSLILPLSIKESWFFLIFSSEKSTNCWTWSMPTTLPEGPT